jgi:hypothetical protein
VALDAQVAVRTFELSKPVLEVSVLGDRMKALDSAAGLTGLIVVRLRRPAPLVITKGRFFCTMQTTYSWLSFLFPLRQENQAVGVPRALNKLTIEDVESDFFRISYFKVGRAGFLPRWPLFSISLGCCKEIGLSLGV